jgi:hypothetical protein
VYKCSFNVQVFWNDEDGEVLGEAEEEEEVPGRESGRAGPFIYRTRLERGDVVPKVVC